jgi:anti-anti-sigma regulatory factor
VAAGKEAMLDLGATLTISRVAEMHAKMTALLGSSGSLTLQGGGIEQIDGAGLQLLAAMIKEAAETGVEIRWDGISNSLHQGARQLGMHEILMKETESDV